MKTYFSLIIGLMLIATQDHTAQQLTPFVISTSGGFSSNGSGMLSFTTGEMSAVETYSSSSHILTQGFQQAWDFSTAINEHPLTGFSFEIYPNPTGGYVQLVSKSETDELIKIKVMDLLGIEIVTMEYPHQHHLHFESMDLTQLPQGIYLVSVHVAENSSHAAYQFVEKINIVR